MQTLSHPRKIRLLPVLVLLLVPLLVLAPFAEAKDKDDEPNFVQAALEGVTVGEGQALQEIIVFPLIAKEKPAAIAVKPSTWAKKIGLSEPEFPKRRFNIRLANNETQPLLMLGGSLLGGGHRDRMIPRDVLIPPGGRVEIESLAAAPAKDQRKEPAAFRLGSSLAPPYLRERAEINPSNSLVPNFVKHFLRFRNEGDERRSLASLNSSTKLSKLCLPCHDTLAAFPMANGGRVVGLVTAVRGRIQALELFGSNRLLKAWFEPMLKSHTFAAAAIALKAKRLKLPIPGGGDLNKAVLELHEKAEKLLEKVKAAKYREDDAPKGSVGTSLIIRTTTNRTRGTATALDGRLVHLAVFPYDPFQHAMFSSKFKVPQEGTEYGYLGEAELDRREGQGGRLTAYERRLLERMRRPTGLGGRRRP